MSEIQMNWKIKYYFWAHDERSRSLAYITSMPSYAIPNRRKSAARKTQTSVYELFFVLHSESRLCTGRQSILFPTGGIGRARFCFCSFNESFTARTCYRDSGIDGCRTPQSIPARSSCQLHPLTAAAVALNFHHSPIEKASGFLK